MTTKGQLSCWTPVTTKILLQGGPSGYNILDHVFPEPLSIQAELHSNGWMDDLQAARTKGDVHPLVVLGASGVPPTTRGDKSRFIPKDFREKPEFAVHHPLLHTFITSIEATVRHELRESMEFSHSSVQIAVYPGDGRSGYPRHCDRSNRCWREIGPNFADKYQRLISCIYYLTPPDWTDEDGGQLRIFESNENHYDVTPFSNRMVIFRSDGVEHQVLPSLKRDRAALTIWVYGRLLRKAVNILEGPMISAQNEDGQGPPPLSVSYQNDSSTGKTIFVAIASYRDSETGPTILALLRTAQYPSRIIIGLVLQVDPEEDAEILKSIPNTANIRMMQLHARDAAGPCYARALCQHLMQGEDYYLQIDSHMRFRRNWDTYLIHALPAGDKSMMTAYPLGYHLPNKLPSETRGTLLVPWKMDRGVLRQRGRMMHSIRSKPIPCYLYAAGFNFSKSTSVHEVPYDITLRHLFFGEEWSMAARLFCAGWNLYAPPESVTYHLWSRAHRPLGKVDDMARNAAINQVIKDLNGCRFDVERTMEQFWKALKVSKQSEKLEAGAENGCLESSDFCETTEEHAADLSELEGNMGLLDMNSQQLIASFLHQLQ